MYDQDAANAVGAGFGIAFLLIMLLMALAFHLFFGYCFKRIALKSGHEDSAGLWWIPIANYLIPIYVAGKPGWWLILFLIPGVNIVASIIVWMAVAEALGRENWWGIIAALFGIVGIPVLAFSDPPAAA